MFHYYNGLKIYYEKIGDGDPVVFLHGWGCSLDIFKSIADRICGKYCVYLIDLPGFGRSSEPDVALDVVGVTKVVNSLIESNRLNGIILIGHSYGGRVAGEYVYRYGNVSKLILIDSAGIRRYSIKKFFKIRIYKFKKWVYKTFKNVMKYNNLVTNSGSVDYVNSSFIMKKMLVYAVNYNQRRVFRCIKCETLIIWGDYDKSTPLKDGKLINRLIKGSELVVIPDSGHFPFIDNYSYFMKMFESYLGV